MGSDADRRAAVATHTRDLSPELMQRFQEVRDRPLLHTRIPVIVQGKPASVSMAVKKRVAVPEFPKNSGCWGSINSP